jgi:hypothetical protein
MVVHNSSNIEHTADKMISLWMPKTTEPSGDVVPGTDGLRVTDNLLLLGVMKQKLGPAGFWKPLFVDPTTNDVKGMVVEDYEL